MTIDIRVGRRVVTAVRIVETTAARGWVVINWTTSSWRRTAITTAIVIVVATTGGAPVTIAITTRAVATRWTTTIIIIGIGSASRGAGSSSITGDLWLSVCNAGHTDAFEFTAVKFLYCGLKIRSSFEFNKASFTIPVTAGLGVDDIEARLTGEVFEVL